MTQKGAHTWDLVLHYHRCPSCGYIFDSRENFEYRLGRYQKELDCPRCRFPFTVTKVTKPAAGPFFGEGEGAEVTWS